MITTEVVQGLFVTADLLMEYYKACGGTQHHYDEISCDEISVNIFKTEFSHLNFYEQGKLLNVKAIVKSFCVHMSVCICYIV